MGGGLSRRPTAYPRDKTPVTVDLTEVWIGSIVAIIVASIFIAVVSFPKSKRCFYVWGGVLINLAFGALILLSQYGYGWDVDSVETVTLYSPFEKEIHADVGLFVGLRGVNITLKGLPEKQLNETINYNERFRWDWAQGRFGFGEQAGRISREYRRALDDGRPLPIVWIAEYFTLDGERIRWGRYYRLAGYYTHGLLWLAFGLWFMMVMTMPASDEVSTLFMLLTGIVLIASNITWSLLRPDDLIIPFEDGRIVPKHGWTWILVLVMGILMLIPGLIRGILMVLKYNSSSQSKTKRLPPQRVRHGEGSDTGNPTPVHSARPGAGELKDGAPVGI